MDFNWFRPKKNNLNIFLDEKGQTSVEYILLIAVIVVIATSVFKSSGFQQLFGAEGLFAKTYREEVEYSYRHTLGGRKAFSEPNYSGSNHDSYKGGGQTRFFGAVEKYGK